MSCSYTREIGRAHVSCTSHMQTFCVLRDLLRISGVLADQHSAKCHFSQLLHQPSSGELTSFEDDCKAAPKLFCDRHLRKR